MVKKRKKPGPRSHHGDGSGWNWALVSGGGAKKRSGGGRPFSLAGAITRIVTFFWSDATRMGFTERRRGRRPMARVHPHRYRRRADYDR